MLGSQLVGCALCVYSPLKPYSNKYQTQQQKQRFENLPRASFARKRGRHSVTLTYTNPLASPPHTHTLPFSPDVEVATGPAIDRRNCVHNVDDQSLNSYPHALPMYPAPMHPYTFSPDVAVVLAVVTVVVGVVVATVPATVQGNAEHNVFFQYLKTANCNNPVPSPPLAYAHTHTHRGGEREREREREKVTSLQTHLSSTSLLGPS